MKAVTGAGLIRRASQSNMAIVDRLCSGLGTRFRRQLAFGVLDVEMHG